MRAATFWDQQLASPLGSTASWVSLSFLEGCCRPWGASWLLPAWMAPGSSTAGQGSHREVMETLTCLHSTGQSGEAAGCEAKMVVICFQLYLEQSPAATFGLPLSASIYKSNKPSFCFVLFCTPQLDILSSVPKEFIFMLSISLVTPPTGLYLSSQGCFGLASFAESHRSVLLPCLWCPLRWRNVTLI